MKRTINHTGRRKLERKEINIRLREAEGQVLSFDVDFFLETKNLPNDAVIVIEAYNRNTLQRFSFGTVGKIEKPDSCILDQIDPTGAPLFRVRIIDEAEKIGRLIASAEGLKPESDEAEDQRSSIIKLACRPLGSQTWTVNIPVEGKPELVINNSIPDAMHHIKSNPQFQSLILPAALRQVLMHYLWEAEFEEGSIQEQWLHFAKHLAGDRPHGDDVSELMTWVDMVVERFSERFELCELLKMKMEEAA